MPDDADLFAAWQAGDRAAGSALIERHFDAIARFFAAKVDRTHQDDLIQRTFLACLEAAASFRGQGSFRAFLFGIARNLLFEQYRAKVRDARIEPDFAISGIADLAPGVVTGVEGRAERRRLVQALQRIPLESQILIELYYWEELSVDELAVALAVPPGTIKSRLHRARGQLTEAADGIEGLDDTGRSARVELDQWLARIAVVRGPIA